MRKNQIKHKRRKIIIVKNEKVKPVVEQEEISENDIKENEEIGRVSFEQQRIDFIASLSVENQKKCDNFGRRRDTQLKEEEKRLEMLRRIVKLQEGMTEEEIQNEKEVQEFFDGIEKRIEEIQKRQKETSTSKQEIERNQEEKEQQSKEQNDEEAMDAIVEDIKKQLKLDKKVIEVEDIIKGMIKDNKYKVSPIRKNNNKSNRVSGTSMEDIFNSPEFKKMWESSEQEER